MLTVAIGAVFFAAPAALGLPTQPAEERARQQLMPKSDDPVWRTLQRTQVTADEKRGLYTAQNPPEVKALEGQDLTVSGFMLSLDVLPPMTHFLLTRYTPVCAFCPPGAPNEAIEVFTSRAVKHASGPIRVRGHFALQNNGASGLFFQMTDAEVL